MANKRVLQQMENARVGAQIECYVAISMIAGEIQRQITPAHTTYDPKLAGETAKLATAIRELAIAGDMLAAQYNSSVSPTVRSSST